MTMICNLNPMWFILGVNVIAAFLVPFLTYRYAHKNNLRTLQEKWISEFRGATSSYVEACSNLYYANDTRYQKLSSPNTPTDADRTALIKRCEEAQSKITAASAKIRLLFKNNDNDFKRLEPLLENLRQSVDKPVKSGDQFHMKPKPQDEAQEAYLKECHAILTTGWDKITK
jgi:hypothetical protein